ncbi:hypothetical protein AOLI_G00011350 [Acnodon oligacanthus]
MLTAQFYLLDLTDNIAWLRLLHINRERRANPLSTSQLATGYDVICKKINFVAHLRHFALAERHWQPTVQLGCLNTAVHLFPNLFAVLYPVVSGWDIPGSSSPGGEWREAVSLQERLKENEVRLQEDYHLLQPAQCSLHQYPVGFSVPEFLCSRRLLFL